MRACVRAQFERCVRVCAVVALRWVYAYAMLRCTRTHACTRNRYDQRIAQCVSNGWPAVKESGEFAGETVTLAFTLSCAICEASKLTAASVNFVGDNVLEGIQAYVASAQSVSLTGVTDIPGAATPTVSFNAVRA